VNTANWAAGETLVLGAAGMLGHELMPRLVRRAEAEGTRVTGWDVAELDIRDAAAVQDALHALKPRVVINAAAYTDVDGCETHVDLALAVNGEAPGHLARACAAVGATLVHFGTDFIFDGLSDRPYQPGDAARPLSVYGQSKWAGEEAVRAAGGAHLIVRTSWLFGPAGRNFVEAILSKAHAGDTLRVVTDQVGRPTLAGDLADAVLRLLDAGATGRVHFANSGSCSWFEFAREILHAAGLEPTVEPLTSVELGRPARRPAYSVLDTATYTRITGAEPPAWRDALRRYLEQRCAARCSA
jgi:dTDP-4-dehydrorhamnose reductase